MTLLIVSFLAGVLTILAPCVLPLLPIVVGGAVREEDRHSPVRITVGLGLSVILFTLLLKATTALLGIPQVVWQIISAGIVLLFGFTFLFPTLWERVSEKMGLQKASGTLLSSSSKGSDYLLGAALGPVFNSCSPTYALIVAVVLPTSFLVGFSYLIAYALGLSLMLLGIAYAGKSIIKKLGWIARPDSTFRRVLGLLFILVGAAVLFGLDKKLQAFILEKGWYDPVAEIEQKF